ncbi:MAG: hypothetical protein IKI84_09820 [Clostridia bacterium]|nr:hypothetical protein [Clostridia bacterium]
MKNGRFFRLMTFALLLSLLLTPLTARAFDDNTRCPASRTGQHDWVRQRYVAPTCTAPGAASYRCRLCGKSVSQSIPSPGHAWGSLRVEYPGTCVQRGMNYRICEKCGKKEYKYGSYGDHVWGPWETVKMPVKGTEGLRRRVCLYDASHIETAPIPATREKGMTLPEPGESRLTVTIKQVFPHADPAGFGLGEEWDTDVKVTNSGFAEVTGYTIHYTFVSSPMYSRWSFFDDTDEATWGERTFTDPLAPGETKDLYNDSPAHSIQEEDVERGYVLVEAYVLWVDPVSGNLRESDHAMLYIPTVCGTKGLELTKGVAAEPENGEFYKQGEDVRWTLTVKNVSDEVITDVVITDGDQVVSTIAAIAPGETVTCDVPAHTVTEQDALVTGCVAGIAVAVGKDPQGVEHTWSSNPVSVPTIPSAK